MDMYMIIQEAREGHGDHELPQAFMFSLHRPILITQISFFGHISFLFRFRQIRVCCVSNTTVSVLDASPMHAAL